MVETPIDIQCVAPIYQAVYELALASGCDSPVRQKDCWEYALSRTVRLTANFSLFGGKYNSLHELVPEKQVFFYCENKLQLCVELFDDVVASRRCASSCLTSASLLKEIRNETRCLTERRRRRY